MDRSVRPRRQNHGSWQSVSETDRLALPFGNMFYEVRVVAFVCWGADFGDGCADVGGALEESGLLGEVGGWEVCGYGDAERVPEFAGA
jgi:hypothetical protein